MEANNNVPMQHNNAADATNYWQTSTQHWTRYKNSEFQLTLSCSSWLVLKISRATKNIPFFFSGFPGPALTDPVIETRGTLTVEAAFIILFPL